MFIFSTFSTENFSPIPQRIGFPENTIKVIEYLTKSLIFSNFSSKLYSFQLFPDFLSNGALVSRGGDKE